MCVYVRIEGTVTNKRFACFHTMHQVACTKMHGSVLLVRLSMAGNASTDVCALGGRVNGVVQYLRAAKGTVGSGRL